jgi:hypothetical protein
MNNPTANPTTETTEKQAGGVNMRSLCQTLARVLVLLDESGYTDENRRAAVYQHDDLPDPASDGAPARLK